MKLAIIDLLGLSYDGETLDKRGLGGSESAVIYLSQELANVGFEVDVFCNCKDSEARPGRYNLVNYIDHSDAQQINTEYDVVVSSRSVFPFFANSVYGHIASKAHYKVLWMHDTFCEGDEHIEPMITYGAIDEIFTLSDFHTTYVSTNDHGGYRKMYEVLKKSIFQTRNGARKWISEVDLSKKKKYQFVYNASATKGLIPLVQSVWPKVKERIPEATLICIGGFYRFREGAEPDAQEQTVRDLMADENLRDLDVEFTGVISQKQIAEILAESGFMIYPPGFPETFGISTLESLLYKTPVITGNFGALEETAFDIACYKIDYPIEPNSLYPHIDLDLQTERFVELVEHAYRDDYLLQQKQNACDVIADIAGWDSVALQWKQHFYKKLGAFLSRDEFRKVHRINQKTQRIFHRKNCNLDDQEIYSSSGKQNRLLVVSPFCNAENYVENCVKSVASQDYDDYLHVLTDDASSDSSANVVDKTISTLPLDIREKIRFEKNTKNQGCIKNQLDAIDKYAQPGDIVILLDGDDWLVNNNTIFNYVNDLHNQGYEFTYGSCWSVVDNIPLVAQTYPQQIKNTKTYRRHLFNWNIPYTHLRTFRRELLESVDRNQFLDKTGNWMKSGADAPLFYELIEQSDPEKIYCVKEIICNYNDNNPMNDYKVNSREQNENAGMSLTKNQSVLRPQDLTKSIPKVDASKNTQDTKQKTILIALPTNKYIETETFKSIYNLRVPRGYTTHLECFYGYQIDQIRNLIAEWGKRYDYLFCVDSDIVLPTDSLEKMLGADKDIISGLYIQRKPGQHTLEIYEDTPEGGMQNIPFRALENQHIVEVAACGFGCVLCDSRVLRTMSYPHFYYQSALDHADTVSEDVYFCRKARELGFRVWADVSIKCSHIGETTFEVISETERVAEELSRQDLLPRDHKQYLYNLDIEPKVIYDIGASALHWLKHARTKWPDARLYAVDASQNLEHLYRTENLEYEIAVASDSDDKTVQFYNDPYNFAGNSYYKENTMHYNQSHIEYRKTLTLDYIVKKNNWPAPDLIKLDVQGAEKDVLKGAEKTLEACQDIILETQHENYNEGAPLVEEVIQYMQEKGFELVEKIHQGEVDADYHFRKRNQLL